MSKVKIWLVLILLLVAACDSHINTADKHNGVVLSKKHHPMWLQPVVTVVGRTTIVTNVIHPECWTVTIKCTKTLEPETFRVSKNTYDSVHVGGTYTYKK